MRAPEAFGPNLRRLRLQKGISLETISTRTNVSVDLWQAMESNDFSRWPTGVAARAYIRDYAAILGLDRDDTVDEFCRVTSHGDRRGYRLLRETATLLGHDLVFRDDLPPDVAAGDRRAPSAANDGREISAWWFANLPRFIAVVDLVVVIAVSAAIAGALRLNAWATLAVSALLYHTVSLAVLGCSPVVRAVDVYMSAHRPLDRRRVMSVFRGIDLIAGKNPASGRRASD